MLRGALIALAAAAACVLAYANEGTAAPMGGLTSAAPSTVTFTPPTIPADGSTQTTAAAFAGAASTDTVQFSTMNGPCAAPSTATFNPTNNDWEATITATTTAGSCTIQASDTTTSATASGTLVQSGTSMGTVSLTPASIPADNVVTTTASVQVTDGGSNAVSTDSVQFTAGAPCRPGPFPATFNSGTNTYDATITASTGTGTCTVTATDTTASPNLTGTAQLTQTQPVGTHMGTVGLSPGSIPADNVSTTTASVQVTDAGGVVVSTDSVQFTAGTPCRPGPFPATFNSGTRTYDATITASTSTGTCTVTATDTTASPNLTGTAQLTQTQPVGTHMGTVGLSPPLILADNVSTTTASVQVTDAGGNVVSTDTVQFTAGTPCRPGPFPATFNSGTRTYDATITASTTTGTCTVTATDTTASPNLTKTAQLTQAPAVGTSMPSFTLTPPSIAADGAASTTATVQVLDANLHAAPSDNVQFTASPPCQAGPITATYDAVNQLYTAPILSTTTAGSCTVTATDTSASPNLTKTAQLVQTAQTAASVSIALSSSSITANGASTTTATVFVADSHGNGVAGEPVTITSTGSQAITPVQNGAAAGVYTATITSTTVPGSFTITAADGALTTTTQLIQTSGAPAHLTLSGFSPGTIVANGASTAAAIATVTDAFGNGIAGQPPLVGTSDPGVRVNVADVGGGNYSVTITSSTTAHAVTVTAIEAGIAVSQGINQVHGPARNLALSLSSPTLVADGISGVIATIKVTDANGNPVSGDQIRLSSSQSGLHFGPVTGTGNGLYTASITSSNHPMALTLVATDTSASPNVSGEATLTEVPAPSLLAVATMQWTFAYHPSYTIVAALQLTGAPKGASVKITCHGGGCPFARRTLQIVRVLVCKRSHKHVHCKPVGPLRLGVLFGGRHLKVGTRVTVEVLRKGWIGKYYAFRVRGGQAPSINISCLAPGGTVPGAGCAV